MDAAHWNPTLGAILKDDNRCEFRVWAQNAKSLELHLLGPDDRIVPMERVETGYYTVSLDNIAAGQRYKVRLDGQEYPDPASRFQPEGVFGPSEVFNPRFEWHDEHWRGVPLQDYVIYELHVGTYTQDGTFDSMIPYLDDLVDLGVNAIELMPIAQFSGDRNWGYDGVFMFAAQNSYGGPDGLRRLVDACHQKGISVILDLVYNHFGPEGNIMPTFGPYLTDQYKTPWGAALNFDGHYSDEVRHYFIENALFWLYEYHIDSLRLDATHFIYDFSAITFMQELIQTVHQHRDWLDRHIYLFSENDKNDANLMRSPERGGWGMDAQWLDDFHHAAHTVLTEENFDYYKGFGDIDTFLKSMREGFSLTGQYNDYRHRRFGTSSADLPGWNFVVFTQNHDQIGNRMPAERLCCFAPFDVLKLSLGFVTLSPYIPMFFMGEEYGETALFNYFTSFQDERLVEMIRKGRKEAFGNFIRGGFEPPDPQAEETFQVSKLNRDLKNEGWHRTMYALHKKLLHLRKTIPALNELDKFRLEANQLPESGTIYLRRWNSKSEILAVFNVDDDAASVTVPASIGYWYKEIDTAAPEWSDGNPPQTETSDADRTVESLGDLHVDLAAKSFVLFIKDDQRS